MAAKASPQAERATAAVKNRFGLFGEQLGRFDWTLGAESRFSRNRSELHRADIRFEEGRRFLERTLLEEFTRIADDLDQQLQSGVGRPVPNCRSFILVINGRDVCVSDIARNSNQSVDETIRILLETTDDPQERSDLERAQSRLRDLARQSAANIVVILRDQAEVARIQLERLGAVPKVEQQYNFGFDLGLRRLTRNGIAASAGLTFQGLEDNYSGKSIQPGFGGKGIPRTYQSFAGLSLEIPLGRGRGITSTGALLQAAELSYQASELTLKHQVRESELRAALAYWHVAAAQERLALIDRALASSGTLWDDIKTLARSEELPAIDVTRAEARVATVRRQREQADRELISARSRLAEALGIAVTSPVEAPVAGEPLPGPAATEEADRLNERELKSAALARRSDVAAAHLLTEASNTLLRGARGNLRRVFDLSLSCGVSGLYESFNRDLLEPGAYWRALSGHQTGPSFSLTLRTAAPFRNRQAKGQLEQASALATKSTIEGQELDRSIGLEVSDALAALRAATAACARRREAQERATRVWEASRELLRAGEARVFDVLVTDEDRLRAGLEEIAARERWAAAIARLRFAAGLTVSGPVPGTKSLSPGEKR